MSINDGGSAFPYTKECIQECSSQAMAAGVNSTRTVSYPGMALRDYFAAKAMQGFAADASAERVARIAYERADAMLAAREVMA